MKRHGTDAPVTPERADPEAPTQVHPMGSPLPDAAGRPPLDEPLGSYRLTGVLGHGGMALVYRAVDSTGREVALKVLQESPFLPSGMLDRFRREAEAAKRLAGHPSIVGIVDTGQVGRNHYIAMQLVPGGRTLVDVLKRAPLPVPEALDLALKIGEALAFAHREGIIHRDIKPANVLMTAAGEPLLADFGLARIETDLGSNLTVTAMALGTPRYMAPEQATSLKSASHLSDMYSFGVILYEMLTGKPPYDINTEMGMEQVIRTIRERIPPSPRRHRPGLSRSLEAVVMKLLDKEPRQRYAGMAEALADLTACLSHSRVRASRFSLGYRADRFLLRHRRSALLLIAASSAVTVAVAWHRAAMRSAQHRQVVPQAEAASRTLELRRLQQSLAGEADEATAAAEDQASAGLRTAQNMLLSAGGGQPAIAWLSAAVAETESTEQRREFLRALAWARFATGQNEEALTTLRSLRDEYARLREMQRLRQNDPRLREAHYAIACLDEALALQLAERRNEAATLWERALRELPDPAPQARLCAAALGHLQPEELVEWARHERPLLGALGCLVAALSAPDHPETAIWLDEARRLANPALPWLYYYLSYGPGAERLKPGASVKEIQP
jgi:serine/threonine-protein kinase